MNTPSDASTRYWIAGIAAFVYVASLALPTFSPFTRERSTTVYYGIQAFCAGLEVFVHLEPDKLEWWQFVGAWLVNPLIWTALYATLNQRRLLCRFAITAAIPLALTTLVWNKGLYDHPGFWTWLGSALVLLAGTMLWPEKESADQAPVISI